MLNFFSRNISLKHFFLLFILGLMSILVSAYAVTNEVEQNVKTEKQIKAEAKKQAKAEAKAQKKAKAAAKKKARAEAKAKRQAEAEALAKKRAEEQAAKKAAIQKEANTNRKTKTDVIEFKLDTPAADETLVYVIRKSAFRGSARGLWVAVNDKVVAKLSSGSHTSVKFKAGINTVNLVQSLFGFAYKAIDNRPGETLYLVLDYNLGVLQELNFEEALPLLKKLKASASIGDPRPNDGYDNGMLSPSVLGFEMMKTTDVQLAPDADTAVITFARPGKLIPQVPFGIWSRERFLGSLQGQRYFQIRVPAGKHMFFATSERFSVLKAEVEAGKAYYVDVNVGMGWNQAHIKLLPVTPKKTPKGFSKWKSNLTAVTVDEATMLKPELQARLPIALKYIADVAERVEKGDYGSRQLSVKDSR